MFTPSLVESAPLPITKSCTYSYDSDVQLNNSRGPHPLPITVGHPFTPDTYTSNINCNQRPFTSFNLSGPPSSSGFPFRSDQPYVRQPPANPAHKGNPPFHESISYGETDTMRRTLTGTEFSPRSRHQPVSKKKIKHHGKPPKSSYDLTCNAIKAAIDTGNVMPPAASEVPFDIRNPPFEPFTAPSDRPVSLTLVDLNQNDVLFGRGGVTYHHIGNQSYRALVHQFQPIYVLTAKKDRPVIARSIVLIVRNRGGRFLQKDKMTSMLYEVGDERAALKAGQALREGLGIRTNFTSNKRKPRIGEHSKRKAKANIEMKTISQRHRNVDAVNVHCGRETTHLPYYLIHPNYGFGHDSYYGTNQALSEDLAVRTNHSVGEVNVMRERGLSLIGHEGAGVRSNLTTRIVTPHDPYYFIRPNHGLRHDSYYETNQALTEDLVVRTNHSKNLMPPQAKNNLESVVINQRQRSVGEVNGKGEKGISSIGNNNDAKVEMISRQDPYYFNPPNHEFGYGAGVRNTLMRRDMISPQNLYDLNGRYHGFGHGSYY